jgi:hypothetical protein
VIIKSPRNCPISRGTLKRGIVVSALLLAVAAIWLLDSPSQQKPSDPTSRYERYATENKKPLWDWMTNDAITVYTLCLVVLNGILAAATVKLWTSTDRLVEGAKDTAQRQLRAYVSLEPTALHGFGVVNCTEAHYILRNTGQTPAKDVRVYSGIFVLPYKTPFPFPHILKEPVASRTTLFPGQHHNGFKPHERRLTDSEVTAILDGTKTRLFYVGIVEYTDVFEANRWTKFCYSVGGAKLISAIKTPAAAGARAAYEHAEQHNEID